MGVCVKICSITNLDDARAAVDAGADYLGFIGVPNTPRFVSPETYSRIVLALPDDAQTIVVVRDAVDGLAYGAHKIQYYGGSLSEIPAAIELIKVIRPRSRAELHEQLGAVSERVAALVLDAYHETKLGGASTVSDWTIAARAVRLANIPVFLAGGLTPENVADAVRAVHPYGVDVSSGVEQWPGAKDHDRLRGFISAAKGAL